MVNMGKGFPGGSAVKNLPAHAGAGGSSLGREDPLEEEMATHSSIIAWKILQTERSLLDYSLWGRRVQRDWKDWALMHYMGKGKD